MDFVLHQPYLIPLLPLAGAVIAGFFGAKYLKGLSHWPIWLGVGAAAVMAIMLLIGALGMQDQGSATEHAATASESSEQSHAEEGAPAAGHASESHAEHHTGLAHRFVWFNWIHLGGSSAEGAGKAFNVDFGYYFDPLTCVMLAVVCGIGFFITVFAAGYMKGEEGYFRFFAYLGLFIFMMTNLVMGENLIMLYLGWEGVGLCSYLLIGYYYDKPAAREAAKKAFLVNRVGDFGFALGIMLCYTAFGTVSYFGDPAVANDGLLEMAYSAIMHPETQTYWQHIAINWVPFLLMLGAFGKSAQFPLYVWLPDAMEGPTPVSALIHAATMVTAGVYMIARCGTLFAGNHAALVTIACVGAFTALFAGTIALRQFDLKKVFAYSTVSQLGFMFVGVGVLAPVAAVFHLVTHAFFKALLFLSSGVVMHAMNGVLDMREMSGLKRVLPKTRILMLIGCFALAGMAPFSGFFSKDEIVHASLHGQGIAVFLGIVLLFTAFLTAYYTFRLYFRVFEGPLVVPQAPAGGHGHGHSDVDEHLADPAHHAATDTGHGHDSHGHGHHNHEPLVMILPLVVLAIGALLAGFLNWPASKLGDFLGQSQSFLLTYEVAAKTFGADHVEPMPFGQHEAGAAHEMFNSVMLASLFISAAGIFLAYALHLRDRLRAERLAAGMPAVTTVLEAKYWVDEFYDAAIVQPLRGLGRILWLVDRIVVDGLVAVLSWVPLLGGWILKLGVQRGSLQGYAAAMLFGVVVILVFVFM